MKRGFGGGCVMRLLAVAVPVAVLVALFMQVDYGGPWRLRNAVPPLIVVALAALTLGRGGGRFTGAGFRLPLATAGFAIPALGLAAYLHYACGMRLDGLCADGPGQLFRFLPVYTAGAGAIGAAIGWIVGRNVT